MHTDVPEFRGCNRKVVPQWLLVVMHHSGLFDEWRMPIATGVAWFHDCDGGELAYWPDGADAPARAPTRSATTPRSCSTPTRVFHGVDRIAPVASRACRRSGPGMALDSPATTHGRVRDGDDDGVADYDWDELRFSVSWKAYCFADDAERDAWRDHADDLTLDAVVDRLVDDLRRAGWTTHR